MSNKQWSRFLVLLLAVVFIFSCKKTQFGDAEFDDHTSEFAFPLFSTTLNLEDLLDQVLNDSLGGDTIRVNPDNSITLFYSGDLAQKKATDIFNFLTGDGVPIPVTDTFFYVPLKAPDSLDIDKVILKKGRMYVGGYHTLGQAVKIDFWIPQMTNPAGQIFTYSTTAYSGIPYISPKVDLNGYTLTSTNDSLLFRYSAHFNDGTPVVFGSGGVNVFFDSLQFSYLEGYWGFQEYPLTRDTIEININQTDLKGDIKVVNPKVTMTVFNSWGFPTRGIIKYLSFIGQNGEELPLISTLFNGDSVDFNYPSFAAGEVGQTKYTSFTLDNTNSNIEQIFNAQPTRLIYDVAGISNAKKDNSIVGFITDSSVIGLRMRVELLLEGSAKNFGSEQRLDLNFGDYSDLDTSKIESVEFKLVTENNIPIDANLQVYFQDSSGVNIDSLFSEGPQYLLRSAPVGADGLVTPPNATTRTEHFIPMSTQRFDRIRLAKQAYLKAYFTTAEGGQKPVRLLANQDAVVKMGLKVKMRL